jgi:acyl dehydratase
LAGDTLDTSDVDRWMGRAVGGQQLREPVTTTDVRRWVQAMQNPNPLYYDAEVAGRSAFGELVPPPSFIIACAINHGVKPALQGTIPAGQHLNAGDEWWLERRVGIGDCIVAERRALDYRATTTRFGPTILQRGETIYRNQRGEVLARQRSTVLRYRLNEAGAVSSTANYDAQEPPAWSHHQLAELAAERTEYAERLREVEPLTLAAIRVGASLPRRPIGPHSIQSFTTEQRSYLYTVWGNTFDVGGPSGASQPAVDDADPAKKDGLYSGSGRKHADAESARRAGMPRQFGYGASMCAYVLDYITNWAGAEGNIVRASVQYRRPVLLGDMTYVAAQVAGVDLAKGASRGVVNLDVNLTNQDATVLGVGKVAVSVAVGEQP